MDDQHVKINNASFEMFCNATEDMEEVKKCLENSLPVQLRPKMETDIKLKELDGHFKESIILMQLVFKNRDAEACFEYLMKNLNMKLYLKDFLRRFDENEGNFYIRVDKQAVHEPDSPFRLLDKGDIIKIKFHFQGFPLKMDQVITFLLENNYIVQ